MNISEWKLIRMLNEVRETIVENFRERESVRKPQSSHWTKEHKKWIKNSFDMLSITVREAKKLII